MSPAHSDRANWVVGERQVLRASDDTHAGDIEVTRVESYRFLDAPWEFALAEGEGSRASSTGDKVTGITTGTAGSLWTMTTW